MDVLDFLRYLEYIPGIQFNFFKKNNKKTPTKPSLHRQVQFCEHYQCLCELPFLMIQQHVKSDKKPVKVVQACQALHTEHEIHAVGSSLMSALLLAELSLSHKLQFVGFILTLSIHCQTCDMVGINVKVT